MIEIQMQYMCNFVKIYGDIFLVYLKLILPW